MSQLKNIHKDLDQPSPFFGRPKDRHQFGKLQAEVIGIECRCLLLHEE